MERANPDVVLNQFMDRNKAVVSGKAELNYKRFHEERERTAREGQKPSLVVIACSDSRVPVEEIFAAYPGEIFVIRTAGNVLDDIGKASLEYALEHLPTAVVMVLGHTQCGAVTATVKTTEKGEVLEGSHLHSIVEKIKPLVLEAMREGAKGEELINASIKKNTLAVLNDILNTMPIAKELNKKGEVKFVAAIYSLESGEVSLLE